MHTEIFEAAASPQYEFQQISYSGLEAVVALWDKAKANLTDENKHHLKPLGLTDLKKHHLSGFPVLGMVDTASNRLAAVLLVTPNLQSCARGYTPNAIAELPHSMMESDSAILQCIATHPDDTGQGVMKSLMHNSLQVAKGLTLCRTFAKVADDNAASRKLFKANDFAEELPTSGKFEDRTYMAHYFTKSVEDVAAEPIALREVPLFNGSYNDNSPFPIIGQRSLG